MPAPELWTYQQGVSGILHIPKSIMLGCHVNGKFQPIAPARAVFGDGAFRRQRKLTRERAEKLWSAWMANNRNPLSADHVRAIRLEEILSGAS